MEGVEVDPERFSGAPLLVLEVDLCVIGVDVVVGPVIEGFLNNDFVALGGPAGDDPIEDFLIGTAWGVAEVEGIFEGVLIPDVAVIEGFLAIGGGAEV